MSNCTVSHAISETTVLGKTTEYVDSYRPDLLYPIERSLGRSALPLKHFQGYDLWRLYEVTWIDDMGLPHDAVGTLKVPATSDYIVESKSLKLYLGSFTQTVFRDAAHVAETMKKDLDAALKCEVEVELFEVDGTVPAPFSIQADTAVLLEKEVHLGKPLTVYETDPKLLRLDHEHPALVHETLSTNLFRSRCPVTGQPDHATVTIEYRGPKLEHESLLAYLVSFRHHQGFHEQCAEQIYTDIMLLGTFDALVVTCAFTRRGGIDISPVRTSEMSILQNLPERRYRQ